MYIAQVNVAHPRFPLDDARMAGFMDNLDRVNAVAERSSGFVWRLIIDEDAPADPSFADDPDAVVNMSVWETAEHLEHFVWNTVHKRIYHRKAEWFRTAGKPYFVMWPVPVGHRPDLAEARDRLDHYTRQGSSDHAFGWEGLPHLKRWMEERCA